MVLALAAPAAQAAFPGANGKIAFSRDPTPGNGICDDVIATINPDGTGATALTADTSSDFGPAWSADGQKLAFVRKTTSCSVGNETEIWVMNADGSGQVKLTDNVADDGQPSWSPDGQKIAFRSNRDGSYEIYVMNADGSAPTRLTVNSNSIYPAWSPDGQKIAFSKSGDIYTMNPDGTQQSQITNTPCGFDCYGDDQPSWSPDGQKIAFRENVTIDSEYDHSELWVMNADGSNRKQLNYTDEAPRWSPDGKKITGESGCCPYGISVLNSDGSNRMVLTTGYAQGPDWQPLPTAPYSHPQSASQLRVSLVPAFKQCGTGANPSNAKHAPPLATNSCNPPMPGSVLAAVGPTSQSSAQMTVVPGDADATNGNQANISITASLTDIQSTAGGDYNPNASGADLTAVTRLRITDKANGYGGLPATATEYDFKVPIDCSSTPDPSVGSSCSANTTANALIPGLIQEQRQTVVQPFRVRIDDSGANGIRGDSDDRIFATQGVFVP
jgi:hypothetical protein